MLGAHVVRIDHIGSTSVPGLVAKDVIDVQVIVRSLHPEEPLIDAFTRSGFALRKDDWNQQDHIPASGPPAAEMWRKLVFGSPPSDRPSNIHVRVLGAANERYALLFRDFLRANEGARQAWSEFKIRLAAAAADRETYGQVKDPATDVLLLAAEAWAAATRWTPR